MCDCLAPLLEMKPNLFLRMELKEYLEKQLGCAVDVIFVFS